MTSTCSISRLLIRAWAPVSFMVSSSVRSTAGFDDSGHEKPPAAARGEVAHGARGRAGRYVITTRREATVLRTLDIETILTPDSGSVCKFMLGASVLVDGAPVGRAAADRVPAQRGAVPGANGVGAPR